MSLTNVSKYRPHRPHRHECSDLQDFLAVGGLSCYRPRMVGYRPFLQIPPAYRPRRNVAFCRSFVLLLTPAVDAVGILASSTDGLQAPCVYPSARTLSMHLPSDCIYPYRCVCGSCSQRCTPTPGRSRQQRPPTPSLRIPKAADARHPPLAAPHTA